MKKTRKNIRPKVRIAARAMPTLAPVEMVGGEEDCGDEVAVEEGEEIAKVEEGEGRVEVDRVEEGEGRGGWRFLELRCEGVVPRRWMGWLGVGSRRMWLASV